MSGYRRTTPPNPNDPSQRYRPPPPEPTNPIPPRKTPTAYT